MLPFALNRDDGLGEGVTGPQNRKPWARGSRTIHPAISSSSSVRPRRPSRPGRFFACSATRSVAVPAGRGALPARRPDAPRSRTSSRSRNPKRDPEAGRAAATRTTSRTVHVSCTRRGSPARRSRQNWACRSPQRNTGSGTGSRRPRPSRPTPADLPRYHRGESLRLGGELWGGRPRARPFVVLGLSHLRPPRRLTSRNMRLQRPTTEHSTLWHRPAT